MSNKKGRNAIFVGCSTPLWKTIASRLVDNQGWKIKLYIGFEERQTKSTDDPFYSVPFLNINDARLAKLPTDAELACSGNSDPSLISSMLHHVDTFMEMLDRFTICQAQASYEQKYRLFKHMLYKWDSYIANNNIDVIILASRSHRIFDYILEILGEYRDIPVLLFEHSETDKSVYALDIRRGLSFPYDVKQLEQEKLNKPSPNLLEKLQKYGGVYDDAKPVAISNEGFFSEARKAREASLRFKLAKLMPSEWVLFKNITRAILARKSQTIVKTRFRFNQENRTDYLPKSITAFSFYLHEYYRHKQVKKARKFYNEKSEVADLTAKFILFPAAYQPERSTCPDSRRYHDLILALSVVSNAAPSDCVIYFKEHPRTLALPTDDDAQRTLLFYKEIINRFPNVQFIDNTYSPFELIDHAFGIALSSGTIALESIARGKSCCLFGDKWFANAPGINQIYSSEEYKSSLRSVDVEQNMIHDYFSELEEYGDDIQYMFESNVEYRRELNRYRPENIDKYTLENMSINADRAVRQLLRVLEDAPA